MHKQTKHVQKQKKKPPTHKNADRYVAKKYCAFGCPVYNIQSPCVKKKVYLCTLDMQLSFSVAPEGYLIHNVSKNMANKSCMCV